MNTKAEIKHQNSAAKNSSLFRNNGNYDFEDSFTIELSRNDVESWEPVAAFLQSPPKWVIHLIELRNNIVKYFGLKVGIENVDVDPPFKPGQNFGAVQVFSISEKEAVIGENDKHLDFKVSFLIQEKEKPELVLSTVVKVNNRLGKAYMFFVKPAHKIIVPAILRRMASEIDSRSLLQHRRQQPN